MNDQIQTWRHVECYDCGGEFAHRNDYANPPLIRCHTCAEKRWRYRWRAPVRPQERRSLAQWYDRAARAF